jgi:hypothetical protein
METQFIEWLIGQAGIAGIAALALYTLNRTYQDAMRREQMYSQDTREDKMRMIQVLEENARAMNGLQQAIDKLCRRSDE